MAQRSLPSGGFFPNARSHPAGFWATLSHILRVFRQPSLTSGVLMRCAVFVGVLAVMAGILGMHVLTGSHASHSGAAHSGAAHSGAAYAAGSPVDVSPAAVGHAASGHAPAADDGERQPGGPAHPAGDAAVVLSAGAVCGEACPGAEEAGAECVPSANAGSLTVVAPPAPAIDQAPPGAAVATAAYSYIPSGPRPCDLSISRT